MNLLSRDFCNFNLDRYLVNPFSNMMDSFMTSVNEMYLATDLYETKYNVVVVAQVPGLEKSDIRIRINRNFLEIEAENKKTDEHKDRTYYYNETTFGKIKRVIRLPKCTDTLTSASASLKNGLLEISFNKKSEHTNDEKVITIN